MIGQRHLIKLTALISVLFGIILPLILWIKDSTYIAIFFTSIWVLCSLILLGYVFLVKGRRNRSTSEIMKEKDSFPPHLMQEWEAPWEIAAVKHKGPRVGDPNWN